jgi:hypothetical protein
MVDECCMQRPRSGGAFRVLFWEVAADWQRFGVEEFLSFCWLALVIRLDAERMCSVGALVLSHDYRAPQETIQIKLKDFSFLYCISVSC